MLMKHLLILFSFLFLNSGSAEEIDDFWGPTGHRATGKIAEMHLSKRILKKIDHLLDGHSLAFVSTYADEIKSERPKYDKYYTWHYINMSFDDTYEASIKNPTGDLVTGINKCIEVLKDKNSSKEDKNFHLKLLVHFMGDLHQPMHIGRPEDKGGNTIQVQWFGRGTNLHRVWDEDMIREYKMGYLELANNMDDLSKAQIEAVQSGSLIDWVHDTHKLTKTTYESVKVGENLRYRYSYDHFKTVRTQLQKGGLRLAKVLEDIFG